MSAIIEQHLETTRPAALSSKKRLRQLRARIVRVSALDEATRAAMWQIFSAHYAAVDFRTFRSDLEQKQEVILVFAAEGGPLCGFSTLEYYERVVSGRRVGVVFSGDTVVAREYWGQTALQRAFNRAITRRKLFRPWRPLYWFLISKGYKTYLLLSRNFVSYWPRHDRPTPPGVRGLVDGLARQRFGSAYCADSGVVHFERCAGRLRPEVAPVDQRALREEEVRFFLAKNPGYADGDELCCLGQISIRQLLYYPFRLLFKRIRRVLQGGSR